MSTVISVENLSKKFIISHEEKEKYTALRDVVARGAKKIFSFPFTLGKSNTQTTKEEFWALKDINFNIEQGDRVGIIGRNGAGKSTLLKVLSRITDPSEGRIRINGRVASLLEVGTGFHPELSGRENIFLNGAILGMSRAEIKAKFDEIVAFAEVEKFLDTPVKRYSSGMYVRLAFAVAAHLEPEILIVDEVLAVGDAQFQKKCLGKMEDVSKNQGRTVLFVSHNMGVIAQLCNKGILLNKGRIEQQGVVQNILEAYLSENNGSEDGYINDGSAESKKNYFTKIRSLNRQNNVVSDYSFDESITLNFEFKVNEMTAGLQVGIGMQDKYNSRIFTTLRSLEELHKMDENTYSGTVRFPSGLIAPNNYTFVFALWTKDKRIYDLLDNIIPVKIHDNGTDLANYEGVDYGSIIINPEWA